MSMFLYRLIPHRSDLPDTMTEAEAAVMGAHVAYWQALADTGTAVTFGPVADPAGAWGLAVVAAETQAEVEALRVQDPAVTNNLGTVDVLPMPGAIVGRTVPGTDH
ncbi:YciI family protein [Micromonosporaceae bacterium B7E4]